MVTRLYFPLDTASEVNPAFGGWGNTAEALRRKLADVKGASAITIGSQIGPWTAATTALDRQYVSAPMNSGISFSAVTVKLYLMTREYALSDNSTSRLLVKIVNRAGDTIRQTLLALGQFGPATEYVNNVTHRNKAFADGDTVTGTYTTIQGDRLVVEIGHTDATGTTPEASCKFGENATDLPENETQTTDGAGWIEFSNTITFESVTIVKVVNETLNWQESAPRALSLVRVNNDTLNWVEAPNEALSLSRVINETLNWSEATNQTKTLVKVINDIVNWSESTNQSTTLVRVINETLQWNESTNPKVTLVRVINDIINWAEATNQSLTINKVINETLNWTEFLNLKITGEGGGTTIYKNITQVKRGYPPQG